MSTRVLYIIGVLAMLLSYPEAANAEYRYRLHLDGKPGSEIIELSERAMLRRERQGIGLDDTDLEVSPEYLSALEAAGLQVIVKSRWLNTVVVMSADGKAVTNEEWQQLPFVTGIDLITTTQRATSPVRDIVPDEEPLVTDVPIRENFTMPLRQLNAYIPLYQAGHRGEGMLIAVLDAGFQKVDKWDWLLSRVVGCRDLYSWNGAASQVYTSDSHGSCCLSIMATPEEHGICGTAQDASYYLIRTETIDSETELEEDMWVAGAELADSIGADVISSSLGYYDFDGSLADHTPQEFAQDVVQISRGARVACQKGMLVCNAAGNEGGTSWHTLLFPADVEEVLTVGGVNSTGTVASFSSRGFTVPYVKPDVLARGQQCYTIDIHSSVGGATSTGAGTSYATPLMAGLCASLWSAVPQLTPAQIRDAVRMSASCYETPDSIHGYGLPDFGVALQLAREWVQQQEESIEAIRNDEAEDVVRRFTPTGRPAGVKEEHGLLIEERKVIFRRKD